MLTVRAANESDYAAIHRLNKDALGYDYDIRKTEERLKYILAEKRNRIFIADTDGRAVGYVHAEDYECTYSDPIKNILAIAVDESSRGKGVGRTLLTAVEDWAKASGATGIRLSSGANREGAHKFYLACGYKHRKDQKNFIKPL